MNLANIAVLGSQALLGLVGLGAGGAKVTHQDDQIEAFQRYGYPQWVRILTGVLELGAGIGLLVGLLWRPELSVVSGLLLSGVMGGAMVTHLRIGDPPSKTAVPAVILALTVALLAYRYVTPL
ncbi:DoxX family protein [Haloarcula nitratireducens]|uniref:DoxX family protein n=1 Tax=Haloarcula nitratireducens TaxID=2487749 RepID=A0AAW4PIX6_9EURY|nr:DoxX family protein [Halomicroarcula nitratireducens]MBX0297990.1 DoxX family protein [Halomicroarcula nitratireducens]